MPNTPTRKILFSKHIEKELSQRLELERMLTDISSKALTSFGASEFKQECLEILGATLDVSRAYIFEHNHQTETIDNSFEWVADGIEPQKELLQEVVAGAISRRSGQMKCHKIIRFDTIEHIPSEREKRLLRKLRTKSMLVVPLHVSKKYYGFMGLDECRKKRSWQDQDVAIFQAAAQIVAGFLERIQTEKALSDERKQLKSIFDGLNQAINIIDPNSHEILYANKVAQRFFQDSTVKKKCYHALHGLDAPCEHCSARYGLLRKEEPHEWEHHNAFIDKYFLSSGRVIHWSGNSNDAWMVISADITDRKKYEQALHESERKYRQLFEMESDAIFLIDNENGKLLEINSACESLYGYSRDQLLRMKNTDLSAEPRETYKATLNALSSVPLRYHRKKDGTVFPVEISARHFVWQGRPVHVAAIRDITSRIDAEQQNNELGAQLRQAQKMESIGTLAGGIAHDFNNILSAITGYTELAMLGTAKSSASLGHLQQVLKASQRAKNLVAQILAFSRQAKVELGPVQIRLIIKETVKMLRATLPASILIDTDVSTDGVVMGDANQIHQVVMNLCTNAYHAMKESGGCLRIDLTEIPLSEATAKIYDLSPGPYMKLMVADTGIGMDNETMRRVFEPYFTTKEKGEGTGLGLSTLYGIVKTHKGAVVAESELGKGSSFSVFFPKIEGLVDNKAIDGKGMVPKGREKILCVDDEPELVNLLRTMLGKCGYQVTTRSSSLEALELFKQNSDRFDLVITDLNMPHLPGDRLAKQMSEIRPDLPIIMCTGFSDQLTERDLAAAGIRALSFKPFLRADLARLIREVLDGSYSS